MTDLECECCGIRDETVKPTNSRTAYVWDGIGDDPNADVNLCPECKKEHDEYWDEMWNEYYQGRL